MKVPKFIARGLASGALRIRPEVMDTIKKLSDRSKSEAEATPAEVPAAEPSSEEKDTTVPGVPPCRSERRLIVVSPLPGRWIRWSCMTVGCAALCLVQLAAAGGNPSAFDAANQDFVESKPVDAARKLEGIIAKQGYSAPALFNLANAQLRAGNSGQAVLNYQRARWLAPADPDIARNFRMASEHIQPAPAPRLAFRWSEWLTFNAWANAGAGSLFLLAATLPLSLLLPARRRVLRFARIVALMALLGSVAAIGLRWGEISRAVVTAKAADARISPVTVGSPIFMLPEGTVVNIVRSHGPFALVSARNGQQGWVSRDTIEPVIAAAR
jgi:hypothetical protein